MAKKSPSGTSTDGFFPPSQYMRKSRLRHVVVLAAAGVNQMCWMAPDPEASAKVATSPAFTTMEGLTFQPRPRYFAAFWPVPVVAMAPLPRSPVGFSGEIERVSAFEVRYRVERALDRPSAAWANAGGAGVTAA